MKNKKGLGPFGMGKNFFVMLAMLLVLLIILMGVRAILFRGAGGIFT